MATVRILASGNPAKLVPLAFMVLIGAGTVLLMLPVATESGSPTGVVTALFTATSAVCVTGLVVVDTATYWSPFGETVILVLIQLGGFGVMTMASLLAVIVARRLRLRGQLAARAETRSLGLGDITRLVRLIALVTVTVEALLAVVLTLRFALGHDHPFGRALWHGVFHSVSSFNNAGFGLWPDNLVRFAADPVILVPIGIAVIVGGLGFPAVFDLRRNGRNVRGWSVHTKITVLMTVLLLVVGWLGILALEWANPGTLGPIGFWDKLSNSWFGSAVARTAGFNSVDVARMNHETWLITDVLMFIGGGSAGTAGGIKVTTFALLAFVIWAEIRGERDVHAFGRRIAPSVYREALTIALLGVAAVMLGTVALLFVSDHGLDAALFEVVSAFGTVGLTTGITPSLPVVAQLVLALLMFVGRVGPVAVASALALRGRGRLYRYPVERPIVG